MQEYTTHLFHEEKTQEVSAQRKKNETKTKASNDFNSTEQSGSDDA